MKINKIFKIMFFASTLAAPILLLSCSNQNNFIKKHQKIVDLQNGGQENDFNHNILNILSEELRNELNKLQEKPDFSAEYVPHHPNINQFTKIELNSKNDLMRIIMTIPISEIGSTTECEKLSDVETWQTTTENTTINWFNLVTGGKINSKEEFQNFKKNNWSTENENRFSNVDFPKCDFWPEILQGFFKIYSNARLSWYNKEFVQGEEMQKNLVLIYSKQSQDLYFQNQESISIIFDLLRQAFSLEDQIIRLEKNRESENEKAFLEWKDSADWSLQTIIKLQNQGPDKYEAVISSLKTIIDHFNKKLEESSGKVQTLPLENKNL